jgi:hypothetical protein
MSESDNIIERVRISNLIKNLPMEDRKEVFNLISQFKESIRGFEIEFQTIALLVFLYKNNLILKQKEKNEKE